MVKLNQRYWAQLMKQVWPTKCAGLAQERNLTCLISSGA
jgi:hypothetical protein